MYFSVSHIGLLGSELQICLDCGGLALSFLLCVAFVELGFRVRLC